MMKALRFLFGWCVLVSVVLGSVRLQAFDRSFYEAYYEKTRLASQIGVSEADLTKSMQVMLDFVQGKRADLNERIVREQCLCTTPRRRRIWWMCASCMKER